MEHQGTGLRRDLGRWQAYATLIGILVGAGIFRVTSDATAATGPSVILAHLLLAPVVLASSVAYLVFLSTPLGTEPGGEVLHIASTFGRGRGSAHLAFGAAWLKLVSYLGAGAYLADTLALNLVELWAPGEDHGGAATTALSLGMLAFFFVVHVRGVRWFGRLQLAMSVVLGLSLVILVVPGLFAIDSSNYRPFFTGGATGFFSALPPLFFAYAGFEALSHAAGEVKDSRAVLPGIFLRGILATTAIFVAMSLVAFGALPAQALGESDVPMSAAAATYLPFGATALVTLGAVMAVATSLNATMLVPARLAWHLARQGQLPSAFGWTHAHRRTPTLGLAVSFGLVALLLLSGRAELALGIAVVALMLLYALHSVALLMLPRRNPELLASATTRLPRGLQRTAAWCSILSLGAIVGVQFADDLSILLREPFVSRFADLDLTSLELLLAWLAVGVGVRAALGSRTTS
jgi:amino acid transporter